MRKERIWIAGIAVAVVILSCNAIGSYGAEKISDEEKREIYKKREYDTTMQLKEVFKPMLLPVPERITGIVGINKKNSFVARNDRREFCMVTLGEEGEVKVERIVKGFPGRGGPYYSENESTLVWQQDDVVLSFLDVETKEAHKIYGTTDSQERVKYAFVADPEKKLVFILVLLAKYEADKPWMYYALYDFKQDKIIYKTPLINGPLYPYMKDKFLYAESVDEDTRVKWHITDMYFKKQEENALTREMTRLQLSVWPSTKTVHRGKRMVLGLTDSPEGENKLDYYSMRWSEDGKKVRVENLAKQKVGSMNLGSSFKFSPDGKWVRTNIGGSIVCSDLLLYHVDERYENGLSLPMYCGSSSKEESGAVVEHDKWGPLYVMTEDRKTERVYCWCLSLMTD